MIRVDVKGQGLRATLPEGRWWKRGKSHRVAALRLTQDQSGSATFVRHALTDCGLTIEWPDLQNDDMGTPCKRCGE